jgi:hypothetical protein
MAPPTNVAEPLMFGDPAPGYRLLVFALGVGDGPPELKRSMEVEMLLVKDVSEAGLPDLAEIWIGPSQVL